MTRTVRVALTETANAFAPMPVRVEDLGSLAGSTADRGFLAAFLLAAVLVLPAALRSIGGLVKKVTAATDQQVHGAADASTAIRQIQSKVGGISEASGELRASADQSASAILEPLAQPGEPGAWPVTSGRSQCPPHDPEERRQALSSQAP